MKKLIITLCLFLLLSCSENDKDKYIGQDINKFFQKNSAKINVKESKGYIIKNPSVEVIELSTSNGKEGLVFYEVAADNTNNKKFAFKLPKDELYYVDIDIDGIIDIKTTKAFAPSEYLYSILPEDNDLGMFEWWCSEYYTMFNRMEGPNSTDMGRLNVFFADSGINNNLKNRALFYSFWCYLDANSVDHDYAISLLEITRKYIEDRYFMNFEIVYLFLGESEDEKKDYVSAQKYFQKLVELDPDSLIGEFYLALMNYRINKDESLLIKFEEKYPDYWILKKFKV